MSDELVPVVLDCSCEGSPHDHDTVYLRPRLGLAAGIAVQKLIIDTTRAESANKTAELTGILAESYLLHGVAAWDWPMPVTPDTIKSQLLDDFSKGAAVADAADDLYSGPVIAPLVKKALTSSPSTSSNGSTSAHGNGHRSAKKPSKRSSITTTRTVATAKTSG